MKDCHEYEDLSAEQYDFFQDLEREWFSTQPNFTDEYLIEVFGDALGDMDEKLAELKSNQKILKQSAKKALARIKGKDEITAELYRLIIKVELIKPLIEAESIYNKLINLINKKNGPNRRLKNGHIGDFDIDRARSYPIQDLVISNVSEVKKTGGSYQIKCPFHEEKTPSMVIYASTNHFHCFGCQEHGDVIKLCQRLKGLDFKESVKYLIGK
jgi:hypothetical protein